MQIRSALAGAGIALAVVVGGVVAIAAANAQEGTIVVTPTASATPTALASTPTPSTTPTQETTVTTATPTATTAPSGESATVAPEVTAPPVEQPAATDPAVGLGRAPLPTDPNLVTKADGIPIEGAAPADAPVPAPETSGPSAPPLPPPGSEHTN